jgi:[CysO sulfur-carrier protein]-S-L-cysteine hydrolase
MVYGLNIPAGLQQEMMTHIQACLPEEGCGLLIGTGSTIEKVFPIVNDLHSPTAFRMNAEEQFKVLIWQGEHKKDLLAIYHSHPNGPDHPSPRDLAEFVYPESPYLIWSLRGRQWRAFGFIINGQNFTRLQLNWI